MNYLRLLITPFSMILSAIILCALFFPIQIPYSLYLNQFTHSAVMLLFFMHGAKLSRRAILNGITHWRLHLFILTFTFIIFPIIASIFTPVLEPIIGKNLWQGMIYLAALPATVQSAIAFTSIAKGNVSAAICSASVSSVIGVIFTPIILQITLITSEHSHLSITEAIIKISTQILIPFLIGHFLRPWVSHWIEQQKNILKHLDQSTILLVVYSTFSAALLNGIFQQLSWSDLSLLVVICTLFLCIVLVLAYTFAHTFSFNTEDKITILFGSSKKSMVTGVPMAQVLFNADQVGLIILPLMIFHQIQLMICSAIAEHYRKQMT